jgi:threonine aldolase
MVVGTRAFIEKGRVYRKMYGGGMRQAGVIAAAGLIALEKSPGRLHIDHENARRLAEGIAQIRGLRIDPAKVRSNIVIFDCSGTGKTAVELCEMLHRRGIWAQDTATYSVRLVTHVDVNREGIERALVALAEVASEASGVRAAASRTP